MSDMSDHFANFIILHSNSKSKEADRPMTRIFSEKNKNTFRKLLCEINWNKELQDKNVYEAMLVFKVQNCIQQIFPVQKIVKKAGQRQTMDYYGT